MSRRLPERSSPRRWPRTIAVWEATVDAADRAQAAEALTALGQASFAEIARPGRDRVTLALYLSPRFRTAPLTRAFQRQFAAPCRIRRRLVGDWQTRWQRSLRVRRLTRRLVLCPSDRSYRAAPGERVIRLDPGLAFGSGSHPTTRFILRMLDRYMSDHSSFLDLGTGSGILTIGACRLGARSATAIDVDPLAIRVARANIRRNRVRGVRLLRRSVLTWRARRRYDIVAANLDTDLVLRLRDRLIGWTRPGGVLCVTGIGATRAEAVLARYRSARLRLVGTFREGAWCGFCFRVGV